MRIQVDTTIRATREAIWQVITAIDQAQEHIEGIEKVEILERPESGIVGLKWRETRTLYGKEATEVMWITEAEENHYYQTRAESHGAVYISRLTITPAADHCILSMSFDSTAQTFGGHVMAVLFSLFFKGSTKKLLQKDLEDIKTAAEKSSD